VPIRVLAATAAVVSLVTIAARSAAPGATPAAASLPRGQYVVLGDSYTAARESLARLAACRLRRSSRRPSLTSLRPAYTVSL